MVARSGVSKASEGPDNHSPAKNTTADHSRPTPTSSAQTSVPGKREREPGPQVKGRWMGWSVHQRKLPKQFLSSTVVIVEIKDLLITCYAFYYCLIEKLAAARTPSFHLYSINCCCQVIQTKSRKLSNRLHSYFLRYLLVGRVLLII